MKRKLKVTSAVLGTAVFASLLALTGCGGEPEVPNVVSSEVVSQTVASVAEPASQVSSTVSSNPEVPADPANTLPGSVQASARADSSYFDDAVFIGDSVSYKLQLYVTKQRQTDSSMLGKAQFLTAGSLGSHNALWEISDKSVHPSYEGQKSLLENSVAAMKAKKVYLMLGMNDVGLYGVDDSVTSMETLIGKILEKSPDAKIYVQSATPILTGFEGKKLNNAALSEYNQKMAQLCQDKGYYFVDVASVMKNEDGTLIREYCSDYDLNKDDNMGVHFTDEGCKVWLDYLYTHTA